MAKRPSELTWTPDGRIARVWLRGSAALASPVLNRGTAFTLAERQALGLTGLLPEGVSTIEGQLARVYAQYRRQPDDLAKNLYLASLRDRNEVLFYRLLTERGERYDELIDAYVTTATRLFPNALLHWEDFGAANAHRILTKYAGTCCTFNDDIQGTAAVVLAAALSAPRAAGTPIRDQTVVIYGAGTAGIGIADTLRQAMITDGLPACSGRILGRWFDRGL